MPKVNKDNSLPLDSQDLANLRQSGLTDETIRANRIRTENGAMVLPYRRLDGTYNGFARRRPHNPRLDEKGRPIKYEHPARVPPRAYFPAGCESSLRNGTDPIFVVEGEKKTLALAQLGYPVVGLGGVWNFKAKGQDELIDDLKQVNWVGRKVYVVFDHDDKAETRRHVDNARRALAKLLYAAGAGEVLNVALPPGPNV